MNRSAPVIFSLIIGMLFIACTKTESNLRVKYEPADNTVLVFAGQDNASVGGNDRFRDGYIENVGLMPAGVTHYISIGEVDGDDRRIGGLSVEDDWNAGPMCLKYYLDSEIFENCAVHLSIAMVGTEAAVAAGEFDDQIDELADFLKEYKRYPFYIRIGYEFDGEWNHYEAEPFKQAFRRVVDQLHAKNIHHFATMMASSHCELSDSLWTAYWPGDDYVDWLGYSYWSGASDDPPVLNLARAKNKPVMMAEIAPRGHDLKTEHGDSLWQSWYIPFFNHIEKHSDVIHAISYINCHWESQGMWKGGGWGDTRVDANPIVLNKWLEKLSGPLYKNKEDNVYSLIDHP